MAAENLAKEDAMKKRFKTFGGSGRAWAWADAEIKEGGLWHLLISWEADGTRDTSTSFQEFEVRLSRDGCYRNLPAGEYVITRGNTYRPEQGIEAADAAGLEAAINDLMSSFPTVRLSGRMGGPNIGPSTNDLLLPQAVADRTRKNEKLLQ